MLKNGLKVGTSFIWIEIANDCSTTTKSIAGLLEVCGRNIDSPIRGGALVFHMLRPHGLSPPLANQNFWYFGIASAS